MSIGPWDPEIPLSIDFYAPNLRWYLVDEGHGRPMLDVPSTGALNNNPVEVLAYTLASTKIPDAAMLKRVRILINHFNCPFDKIPSLNETGVGLGITRERVRRLLMYGSLFLAGSIVRIYGNPDKSKNSTYSRWANKWWPGDFPL